MPALPCSSLVTLVSQILSFVGLAYVCKEYNSDRLADRYVKIWRCSNTDRWGLYNVHERGVLISKNERGRTVFTRKKSTLASEETKRETSSVRRKP